MVYTSPPGRSVHSGTNSTSLGSTPKIICFPHFISMAILDFMAHAKIHDFETGSSNAVKSCTPIENIQTKNSAQVFSVSLKK